MTWKTTTITMPSGQKLDIGEVQDYLMTFKFQLKAGWRQNRDIEMASTETFTVMSIEGSAPYGATKAALEATELTLTRSDRTELQMPLSLLTVHDTVLEARLHRLESLVDGILSTDMDENSDDPIERRMARRRLTLHRLGYKPTNPLDHRRLVRPILFGGTERGQVTITCAQGVPATTVKIILRGLRRRPVA
jgi:hypothetical protein